jgi:hypothetical protein
LLCCGCGNGAAEDTFAFMLADFANAVACSEKHQHFFQAAGKGCYIYHFYKKLRINNGESFVIDIRQRPDKALI